MKCIVHVNRETMNAFLPPIPPDFESRMRDMIQSMPAERKEKPMRKKLSAGFVLALVLCLLTAGALAAALLGGKDFVDQIMAPKAAETASEKYTSDEVKEILRIAEENGLTLSDHDRERLRRLENAEEGYWKEELMRLFVKTEYGFYPAAWPIEVQHWYEEMLEACGQGTGFICSAVPEEGEILQEEAIRIAIDYIHANYDPDVDVTDESLYARFMTYSHTFKNPLLREKQWWIEYEAQDLYHADYELTISPQGEVKTAVTRVGVLADTWEHPGFFIEDRFRRIYGDPYGFVNWDSEIMLKYQEAVKAVYEKEGDQGGILDREMYILDQQYLLPDAAMIAKEKALELAKAACGDQEWETLYSNSQMAVCLMGEKGPAWKVTLSRKNGHPVYVQLDAKTGNIQFCDLLHSDTCYTVSLWRAYVSEEYWEANKPTGKPAYAVVPAPTPRADGKPPVWGSSAAPEWYWEKPEQVGYTPETAGKLYTEWENTYGWDRHLWPLEYQAVVSLYEDHFTAREDAAILPGLPFEDDMTPDQALAIAKSAFREEYSDIVSAFDIPEMFGAFSYDYNWPDVDHNCWKVWLYHRDGSYAGSVFLDSWNGEIFELESTAQPGIHSKYGGAPIATPTPLPDGKPWMWGMDFAPASFWDQLEQAMKAQGVTFENFPGKYQQWQDEYAQGGVWFAPPDLVAIANILNSDGTEEDFRAWGYNVFPSPGGITWEQAQDIGWQEFLRLAEEAELSPDWVKGLKAHAQLCSQALADVNRREPTWVIQLFDWYADCWNTKAWIYLDETGAVVYSELDLNGNG